MFYLDSCVLVAALTKEVRTDGVIEWLSRNDHAGFAYSDWVSTEFSAALSIKLRNGQVAPRGQAGALALYASLVGNSFTKFRIFEAHFIEASRLAENDRAGIRAGDALHLAVCMQSARVTLCTLDAGLAAAGPRLGVETLLL